MSLDFEMYNSSRSMGWAEPDPKDCPIIMAGICYGKVINRPAFQVVVETEEVYRIDECGGELEMFDALTSQIQTVDPDILFTYSGNRFDLPYANARAVVLAEGPDEAVPDWPLKWGRDGSRLRMSRDI